jgi:hypothetical protein
MLASFWSEAWKVMSQEPLSFLIGAVVGFGIRGRFKIVREKREEDT